MMKVLQFIKAVGEEALLHDENASYFQCIALISKFKKFWGWIYKLSWPSTVSPSFLKSALLLRERLLGAALNEQQEDIEESTIISCVDVFFTYFADMVLAIACNQNMKRITPNTLDNRLRVEALQLASQLPRMYSSSPYTLPF